MGALTLLPVAAIEGKRHALLYASLAHLAPDFRVLLASDLESLAVRVGFERSLRFSFL